MVDFNMKICDICGKEFIRDGYIHCQDCRDPDPNRRTGRTTRMLKQLAEYIRSNLGTEKTIMLTADNNNYAWDLSRQLIEMLGLPFKRKVGEICFDRIRVIVMTYERSLDMRVTAGINWDKMYHDHYDRKLEEMRIQWMSIKNPWKS